ncbi:uncharacterized protein PRCAT00002816001 [Priceomyces carsonii]|uniref:uncharacterized protein n=1 Tax=Priceomyces carsonii TaxID=28549 RepID=UPI002ED88A03|nr:unnamed protein product [Priceomyces carsonii]
MESSCFHVVYAKLRIRNTSSASLAIFEPSIGKPAYYFSRAISGHNPTKVRYRIFGSALTFPCLFFFFFCFLLADPALNCSRRETGLVKI